MVPGFNLILERVLGLVDTKALYCAVDLGLPELLAGGPRTAAQLAATSGSDPDAIDRLMRFLVSRGIFKHRNGRYANNSASDRLRADHPYSFRDWVLFFGSDWNLKIWNEMPGRVRTGRSAAEAAFGVPFFTYLGKENPAAGRAFAGAMAAGSRLQAMLFAESIDFRRVNHVCDIGGGSGSVLAHLLRVHPALRGTVLDLPELAPEAQAIFEAAGVADRATFVGGDFFEAVPAGCDLYIMFAVIHDWDDDRCTLILSNIRKAMAPGGRIMVIEGVVPMHDGEHFLKTTDMLMLVLGDGGRERTAAEFEALWERAGLRLSRRTMLPSTFEVFELVASA
jgi:O-methyltransferase domain/Dimerisation domain